MSFLEDYIQNVAYLPSETVRSLELIRLLDDKVQELTHELNSLTSAYFASISSKQENNELLQKIQEKQKEALDLSDEKIVISKQLIEMVEEQMSKLNIDLEQFKKKLKVDAEEDYSRVKKRGDRMQSLGSNFIEEISMIYGEEEDDMHMGDESEKKYCYCMKPSYGDMVACDNPRCPREWFHFECVGLVSKPKGHWYCPDCLNDKRYT